MGPAIVRLAVGAAGLVALTLVVAPDTVYAHGFGERYDLPVPLSLYIGGAGAAVALSFVVVGLFVRGAPGGRPYPRADLFRWKGFRGLAHPTVVMPIKAASLGILALVIVSGFWGDQEPTRNITPTVVWVLWWVGIAYASVLIGNVWALLNPWKTAYQWAGTLWRRFGLPRAGPGEWEYPEGLGALPAVMAFAAFAWVEVVYADSGDPSNLAVLALAYSAFTWIGMFLFGPTTWLRNGEVFSIVFGVFARLAPLEVRVTDADACAECSEDALEPDGSCVDCYECFGRADPAKRGLALRPYATGLLRRESISASQMILILLMLATVTFDGFTETPFWVDRNLDFYDAMPSLGRTAFTVAGTTGLFLFPIVFVVGYLGFTGLVTLVGGGGPGFRQVARGFVFSLVPIAFAYHLAHFFSFFLIQGQFIIPLVSDPFGQGWDIFGTTSYIPDVGIVNARIAWFVGVGAIVVGHIVAVYTAHVVSLRLFTSHRRALLSQLPMLILMVGYTMISLWIIAQPIVEASVPS